MQWRKNALPMGFLCIFVGIILIWSTSASSEGSVFIFFPFFVFGGSDSLSFAMAISLVLVIFIITLRLTSNLFLQADAHTEKQDRFIPKSMTCAYCSKPIPSTSSFCSFCGSPVKHNDGSNRGIGFTSKD